MLGLKPIEITYQCLFHLEYYLCGNEHKSIYITELQLTVTCAYSADWLGLY